MIFVPYLKFAAKNLTQPIFWKIYNEIEQHPTIYCRFSEKSQQI